MQAGRWLWALWIVLSAASCAPRPEPPHDLPRTASAPGLVRVIQAGAAHGGIDWTFAPLTPQARARDLEVLLFSSGSTAYDGYVLRASSLHLLKPWLQAVEPAAKDTLRAGLAPCVPVREGRWLALPLTADAVVLALREKGGGPADPTLDALERWCRDDLPGGTAEASLGSTVPPLDLFWALALGQGPRKAGPGDVYGPGQIRALTFLQEHHLRPAAEPQEALDAFLQGRVRCVFLWASEVKGLVARARSAEVDCRIVEVPHEGEQASALYGGFVWARPSSLATPLDGRVLLGAAVQETLALAGHLPAAAGVPSGSPEAEGALGRTLLLAPPDLGERGQEILEGALLDTLEAGFSPEEALRRAQARMAVEGSP